MISANWTRENIAWAAGLFDGEGCITEAGRTLRLCVTSTDRDIVDRFREVIGCGFIRQATERTLAKPHYKVQFDWILTSFEKCQAVIATFWPWLCNRRKKRFAELISKHREYPVSAAMRKKSNLCPRGHAVIGANLYLHPKGTKVCRMCRDAYMRAYRKELP